MATIKKREGKTGTSYLIRASCGYDTSGRQVMRSMTWKPKPGMTEKQIEKELNRQAVLFDEKCSAQGMGNGNVKFQTFAEQAKSSPMREDCKAFIMKTLHEAGGAMSTADLDKQITTAGYSFSALKRAKAELKKEGNVKYFHTGSIKERVWHIQALVEPENGGFEELSDDTKTPFESPIPSSISKVV